MAPSGPLEPGMSQSRNKPSPREWLERKHDIEQLYLVHNRTLEDVRDHFEKRGFEATIRQYKTKLKAWGFDSKKIRGDVWKAMSIVMAERRQHGLSSAFYVPHRGHESKPVTADMITKQMRRNNVPVQDVATAYRILERQRVEIVLAETPGRTDHPHTPTTHGSSSRNRTVTISQPLLGPYHSSYSPVMVPMMSQPPMSPPITPTFDLTPRSTHPSESSQLPSIHNLFNTMQPTLTNHHHHHHPPPPPPPPRSSGVVFSPLENYQLSRTSTSSTSADDFDLASAFGQLSLDPTCDLETRESLKQCFGQTPNRTLGGSLDSEKKLAVKWAAYYVLNGLPQYAKKRNHQGPGRAAAMSAFHDMLTKANRFIFPYCNWMLTVLAANGSEDMVQEFLSDCCKVTDQTSVGHELTYGSPFHFALALYTDDECEIKFYSRKYEESNRAICMLWGRDSPNYLINQYYFAWHLLEKKEYDQALEIVHSCLPKSESIMGPSHTVTINCLAMLSRAYDEMGQNAQAMRYLKDALDRLSQSAEVLQAYRFRLRRRLAMLQEKAHDLNSAEHNLVAVMNFRIAHFGIESGMTWDAIELLTKLFLKKGRPADAASLGLRMREQFDAAMARSYIERQGMPAPWICSTCQRPRDSSRCCAASRSSSRI